VIGFCGGGWNALLFGAQSNDIGAVVAYYAPVGSSNIQHRAPLDLASYIRVPVQYHRVRTDPNAPPTDVDRFQALLAAQGTVFERHTYDAEHGFFAYDRTGIFKAADAAASWQRTVTFLRTNLRRPPSWRELAPPAERTLIIVLGQELRAIILSSITTESQCGARISHRRIRFNSSSRGFRDYRRSLYSNR
jgi:Dienelactone hydrolase family